MTTLRCARCAGVSPAEAQFCIECGAPLTAAVTGSTVKLSSLPCPQCQALNPAEATFCGVCGSSMVPATPPPVLAPPPGPRPSYGQPNSGAFVPWMLAPVLFGLVALFLFGWHVSFLPFGLFFLLAAMRPHRY